MVANNADRWGKQRPESLRLLLDLFCDGQAGRKDYVAWLSSIVRTGDNLADREKADLIKWLIENGHPTKSLGKVYTVQYTHDECAAAIGCDVRQSKRYRDWLVSSGVLITVQSGKKGYPGFFIQAPVMVTNDGENVTENKGTKDSGFGDNPNRIRGQQKAVTSANAATSRVIQSNPETIVKKFKCPTCGGTEIELSPDSTLYWCAKCKQPAYRIKS